MEIDCIMFRLKFERGLSSSVSRNKATLYQKMESKTGEFQKSENFEKKSQMCSKAPARPSCLFQTLVSAGSNRSRLDAPAQVRKVMEMVSSKFYWLNVKLYVELAME
jgi:hypothetical protein